MTVTKKLKYRPPVDVVIPEQLAASYGLYIWPSAPVLAWYLWLHQVNCQYSGYSFNGRPLNE